MLVITIAESRSAAENPERGRAAFPAEIILDQRRAVVGRRADGQHRQEEDKARQPPLRVLFEAFGLLFEVAVQLFALGGDVQPVSMAR